MLARRRHPAGPNSLDALCKRYGIDNSQRTKHGALMDSLLLANVYVELLGERQATLGLGGQGGAEAAVQLRVASRPAAAASLCRPGSREAGELAHREFVKTLGPKALWLRFMRKGSLASAEPIVLGTPRRQFTFGWDSIPAPCPAAGAA